MGTTSNFDLPFPNRGQKPPDVAKTIRALAEATDTEVQAVLDIANTKSSDADVVKLTGDQTIAGKKDFSTIPEAPSSNPTTDNQLTRKKYVDDGLATAKVNFGTYAERPDAGVQGRMYRQTDAASGWSVGTTWVDTGVAWVPMPGTIRVDTFTVHGTWTKQAGAKIVEVAIINGGGGGGRSDSTNGGGGGAGGMAVFLTKPADDLPSSASVTIGIGGGGRTGSPGSGSAGGTSAFNGWKAGKFGNSDFYSSGGAADGGGGSGGSGGGKGESTGGSSGGSFGNDGNGADSARGHGSGLDLSSGGGGGGANINTGGEGGLGTFGGGGRGGDPGQPGSSGTGYGGGGGGGGMGQNGGNGAPGAVIVTTYF